MTYRQFSNAGPARFRQQVERAALDLRCGVAVRIEGRRETQLVAPLDGITEELFEEMRNGASGRMRLVLGRHRLAHLGFTVAAGASAVALSRTDSLADTLRWTMERDGRWPAGRALSPATAAESAGLALLRRAQLIPALLSITPNADFSRTLASRLAGSEILSVTANDVLDHCAATPRLRRVSEADVPLEPHTASRFVVFREARLAGEHVAVLIGDRVHWPDAVPVRVHSACLTGDLFGSLRCDCGSQLRKSVALIAQRGGGVLLYLAQEGRSTGMANKMRAYRLQDGGLDTFAAGRALGFDGDQRAYTAAREMLAELGVTRVDLLTNNPEKLAELNREPIQVAGGSRVLGRLTAENRRYLAAKASRAGHRLDGLMPESCARHELDRVGRPE